MLQQVYESFAELACAFQCPVLMIKAVGICHANYQFDSTERFVVYNYGENLCCQQTPNGGVNYALCLPHSIRVCYFNLYYAHR